MNTSRNETDEILNELTSIEFDDDDALTLLDDEETPVSSKSTVPEIDLSSLYDNAETLEIPEKKVDLYTEKVVAPAQEKQEETIDEKKELEELPKVDLVDITPSPKTQRSTTSKASLDAYLNGSLESKRSEVKVEKVVSTLESAVEPTKPVAPSVEISKSIASSTTPVKEEKLDKVDYDNISQLFARVSNNVRGASDIVSKNAEIKRKIDERFHELQKLQEEHERNKQSDYTEINAYKDEVYTKLKDKKKEIEEQMTALKQSKEAFEVEKKAFEKEKLNALADMKRKEQEFDRTCQEKWKGIEQIENGLVKRKEQLDLERAAIQQEKAQCEKEKKDLAENLLKFNQLVDDFTKGVDRFNETN